MKATKQKIVCLTAYDYTSAMIAEAAGVDLILVGDSLGTVIHGAHTTTGVSLDDILYHTSIVSKAASHALIVADLPFGSYGSSLSQAVESSVKLVRAGAHAVKLEGAFYDEISAIRKIGIPVMGHIGMTPQSVNVFGGHKVQGKGNTTAQLVSQAKEIEVSGAFAVVLELMTSEAAAAITQAITIPTIGIGAGIHCDGQVQVFHDITGLFDTDYKHAKKYVNGLELLTSATRAYVEDVRNEEFPGVENSF